MERNVGQFAFSALFVVFKNAGNGRQCFAVVRFADQPCKPCGTPCFTRFRMHHFNHVCQRRRIADGGVQQLFFGGGQKPSLHQFFRTVAEGFSADCAAADNLCEVTQHFTVVHHLVEYTSEHVHVFLRQHGKQQRRHIFHQTFLTGIYGSFGDKLGIQALCQFQHLVKLALCIGIEGIVQTTGSGKLCQLLFGRQRVGDAAGFIMGIGFNKTVFNRLKQGSISHFHFLSYCWFEAV